MATESNALPWFPLTPDYIDKYNESVIKYLKDEASSENKDKSFSTTVSLLHQRAQLLLKEFSAKPLDEAEIVGESLLLQYIKTIGAEVYLLKQEKEDSRMMVSLLAYLLSLYDNELTDEMSIVITKAIHADKIEAIAFDLSDLVNIDINGISKKLSATTFTMGNDPVWLENKGTVLFDSEGISLFDMNRSFIKVKKQTGGSFKKEEFISHVPVLFQLDKKDKREFSLQRFINSIQDITPSQDEFVRKKEYEVDDKFTVRITSKGYEDIYATSIDPSYETISGKLDIGTEPNVRGIALSDLSWNLNAGDLVNVILNEDGSFSIRETILDYIYNKFWDTDDERNYARMSAKLLFPKSGQRPNTWLTEYGFFVRSGFEDVPMGAYRVLADGEFNQNTDWLTGFEVDEEDTAEEFTERDAKAKFINLMVYETQVIKTPALPKIVIKVADPSSFSMLHRTLALKSRFASSSEAPKYFIGCCAMAAINEDERDMDYYSVKMDYHNAVLAFAANKISAIKGLDTHGINTVSTDTMSKLVETIAEYGRKEESEYLNEIISDEEDNELSTIAKLVQAANRFQGNAFLETLRGSLHREICTILEVSDSIEGPQTCIDDDFPFEPEGPSIEHKMSWVFDNETGVFNETTQSQKIMKSICAFLNNSFEDGGGHIYIGTDEKRRFICGVDADIKALLGKGILTGEGDVNDEYYRHISGIIKNRFPENYEKVKAQFICDGRVLDIYVSPADGGVVYFNGIAYEKYNSSARPMREDRKEAIISQKFLQKNGMAEKISNILKAKHQAKCVILKGYDSSNSNTDRDRKLEVFAFTDNNRRDGVWAYDPKDRKNKVFLLKRAEAVEITDESWQHAKQHKTADLDIFGYFGEANIPFDITLKSIRAKNLFIEQFPDAKNCLEKTGDKVWRIRTTLLNPYSLNAACSFYLGYSDDLDISATPALVKIVTEKINSLLEKI